MAYTGYLLKIFATEKKAFAFEHTSWCPVRVAGAYEDVSANVFLPGLNVDILTSEGYVAFCVWPATRKQVLVL